MKANLIDGRFRPVLRYPDTWCRESVLTYERLREVWGQERTQAEIDRIEEQLVWYRNVRDEYAGIGGHNDTENR